jgi:hypothetical protein
VQTRTGSRSDRAWAVENARPGPELHEQELTRLDQVDQEGARPLRPLALALKILSTMLRLAPRGRPSHSAETRRLPRHFALWVRIAYDRSSRLTREGP